VWQRVIREAAGLGVLQVGFSGGELLLYPALAQLVSVARDAGLYSNLITSGLGLDFQKAEELKRAGLDTVQISLARSSRSNRSSTTTKFAMSIFVASCYQ
jgi:PqqA peptide cyclase